MGTVHHTPQSTSLVSLVLNPVLITMFIYSALRLSAEAVECPETMHVRGVGRYPKSTKRYTA